MFASDSRISEWSVRIDMELRISLKRTNKTTNGRYYLLFRWPRKKSLGRKLKSSIWIRLLRIYWMPLTLLLYLLGSQHL